MAIHLIYNKIRGKFYSFFVLTTIECKKVVQIFLINLIRSIHNVAIFHILIWEGGKTKIEKVYVIQFSIDWLKLHFHARDNLNRFYFLETYFHHKDNFCTIITRKQVSKSLRSFVFISFIFNTVVCIYLCVCISSIQHDILLVTSSIGLTECKRHLLGLLLAHNWKLTCRLHCGWKQK